jgi:hypothetical protein
MVIRRCRCCSTRAGTLDALLSRLPGLSGRDGCDELSLDFCGVAPSKAARRALARALAAGRNLAALPFYARVAATLSQVGLNEVLGRASCHSNEQLTQSYFGVEEHPNRLHVFLICSQLSHVYTTWAFTVVLVQVFPEVAQGVVAALEKEFRGLQLKKDATANTLEARIRNARFLAEMAKFRLVPW